MGTSRLQQLEFCREPDSNFTMQSDHYPNLYCHSGTDNIEAKDSLSYSRCCNAKDAARVEFMVTRSDCIVMDTWLHGNHILVAALHWPAL